MKERDLHTILYKIIGSISPVGETHTDGPRFENLEEFAELVYNLVWDLHEVSQYADRPQYSMHQAGERAKETLEQIRELIG